MGNNIFYLNEQSITYWYTVYWSNWSTLYYLLNINNFLYAGGKNEILVIYKLQLIHYHFIRIY